MIVPELQCSPHQSRVPCVTEYLFDMEWQFIAGERRTSGERAGRRSAEHIVFYGMRNGSVCGSAGTMDETEGLWYND